MRLVFEISKDELLAALKSSDGDTISVSASPRASAQQLPAAPKATPAAAPKAALAAPAADSKGKPGRKSNAQKEAEAAAAAAAASTDSEELDLDAELTGETGGDVDDDMEALLQDDDETEAEAEDELIGNDNVLKKKLADALQANKKKNNGKAGPATDILRKYAPNLSISEVKKKDVPALLKDLGK
jgi:hypothetical protein